MGKLSGQVRAINTEQSRRIFIEGSQLTLNVKKPAAAAPRE